MVHIEVRTKLERIIVLTAGPNQAVKISTDKVRLTSVYRGLFFLKNWLTDLVCRIRIHLNPTSGLYHLELPTHFFHPFSLTFDPFLAYYL